LDNAKAVAPHPEQETLLSFCADVDARVEKRPQQPTVSQQHAQEFIVVDIDVVEARGMKQVIPVNENCHSAAVAELP
jgi:hypothetical protein